MEPEKENDENYKITFNYKPIAQRVEHAFDMRKVESSSLSRFIKNSGSSEFMVVFVSHFSSGFLNFSYSFMFYILGYIYVILLLFLFLLIKFLHVN